MQVPTYPVGDLVLPIDQSPRMSTLFSKLPYVEAFNPSANSMGLQGIISGRIRRNSGGRAGGVGWDPVDAAFARAGWLSQILPALEPARRLAPIAVAKPQAANGWTDEAIAIADSLLRTAAIERVAGGLEIHRTWEGFDPRWDRLTSRNEEVLLVSPTAWLRRPLDLDGQTIVNWCTAAERGAFSRAYQLGCVRESREYELRDPPLPLAEYLRYPVYASYPDYVVTLERPAAGRAVLTLTPKTPQQYSVRLTIDVERAVVLEQQVSQDGVVSSTTTYDDFVEVAGAWWARRIDTRDVAGELISRTTFAFEPRDAEAFATRLAEELPLRAGAERSPTPSAPAPAPLIRVPLPPVQSAREQVLAGTASVEAQLVVLTDLVVRQQWDEAFERFATIEATVEGADGEAPAGLAWMRLTLELLARRNATALERINAFAQELVAAQLAAGSHDDAYFLANRVLDIARDIAAGNEQLRLLDVLRPVFEASPEHVAGLNRWRERRVSLVTQPNYDLRFGFGRGRRENVLQSLGRGDEFLALRRELAEAEPWNQEQQISYAYALSAAGEQDDAYAWLQQELDRNPRREESGTSRLVRAYADMLNAESRYDDAADFLAERVERNPEDTEIYARYLSALVYADRLARAEELVTAWLAIDLDEENDRGRLAPADAAKLDAAVDYARGERYNISIERPEEKWLAPLAATARRWATRRFQWSASRYESPTSEILRDWRFSDSDEADALRRALFATLQAEVETFPSDVLPGLVSWAQQAPGATTDQWREVAAVVRRRWENAADETERSQLDETLLSIYSNRFADSLYLPFLRERIDAATEATRPWRVRQLFDALIGQAWTAEHEAESIALIPRLSAEAEPIDRLGAELPALAQWVDRMLEARVAAAQQELLANGHPEELTRAEYAAKNAEFVKTAREGVAERLLTVEDSPEELLARWARLERITLDVRLERRLDEVAAACWELLGDAPPRLETDDATDVVAAEVEIDEQQFAEQDRAARIAAFEAECQGRALAIVSYLAVRRSADDALVDRLLDYVDAGIAQGGDAADGWRAGKFQLLLALDRPAQLERELRTWIAAESAVSAWRAPLGRLLAERGDLAGAIELFEQLRANDALAASDRSALATWYLAVDRRSDYEQSTLEAFMNGEEDSLQQLLDNRSSAWDRGEAGHVSELDDQTLLVFRALFRKATSPGQYLRSLASYYGASHDFRLLDMVPDAMLGRTPQEVYEFVGQLEQSVLPHVRDEAAADELLGRVTELRSRELSPLDARALDLLEALVERKASEVLNQPGPHTDAAVAALERAFTHEWADGEQLQMAQLLWQLERITSPRLAEVQVRQLRVLYDDAERGSLARLQMGAWLAHALYWTFQRGDEGLAVIDSVDREFLQANDGVWPNDAGQPLGTYLELLQQRNRYAAAESFLQELLERPESGAMERELNERLNRLYAAALADNGQVSLGRGVELFTNLVERLDGELAKRDENYRYETFNQLMNLLRTSHERPELAGAADEALQSFARDRLPQLLESQPRNYSHYVSNTAERMHQQLGPREALAFLLPQMDRYPARLEMSQENAWNQFRGNLSNWREELGDNLGELEEPLLRITLQALRRHLETRAGSRYGHTPGHHFGTAWPAKHDVFAATAREVLEQRRHSGQSVVHIAEYLYHSLELRSEAIDALQRAHREGILDDAGQRQLVTYLHETAKYADSIPLLVPFVERRPEDVSLRTQLMTAYHRTNQLEALRAVQRAADEYLRTPGRWSASVAADLAGACRQTGLLDEAVDYYQEAIDFAQRQGAGPGGGGLPVPEYYRGLAETYSQLGRTKLAVEAAAGAVVAWGPDADRRRDALNTLAQVMDQANDLEAFAAELDRDAQSNGADSPLIRQMLGTRFSNKDQWEAAERQLRIAIALDPTDLETHEALIDCFTMSLQDEKRTAAVRALLDVDPRNLEYLDDLAAAFSRDESQAERAATNIVEASPAEAEYHEALARRRDRQQRWVEAAVQWRHVARIRALEPTGLLGLARTQIALEQWDAAAETVQKLLQTDWPEYFESDLQEVQELRAKIEAGRE
jgi:hypothetical protein